MFDFFQFILWLLIGSVVCTEKYFETYFIEPEPDHNSRNAMQLERYKWPGGIVYYVFDKSYNANDQNAILTAMDLIVQETCIEFAVKDPSQKEHIRFRKVIFIYDYKGVYENCNNQKFTLHISQVENVDRMSVIVQIEQSH